MGETCRDAYPRGGVGKQATRNPGKVQPGTSCVHTLKRLNACLSPYPLRRNCAACRFIKIPACTSMSFLLMNSLNP